MVLSIFFKLYIICYKMMLKSLISTKMSMKDICPLIYIPLRKLLLPINSNQDGSLVTSLPNISSSKGSLLWMLTTTISFLVGNVPCRQCHYCSLFHSWTHQTWYLCPLFLCLQSLVISFIWVHIVDTPRVSEYMFFF